MSWTIARRKYQNKIAARSPKHFELFLECLKLTGNIDVARRYSGQTSDDLTFICASTPGAEERIAEAQQEGESHRINQAISLLKQAGEIATITNSVSDMLLVADRLAPEVTLKPMRDVIESSRALAGPQSAVQVNIGLSDLASRLQEALKENI